MNGAKNPAVGTGWSSVKVLPAVNVAGNDNTESLAYLFDPDYGGDTQYRRAYTNVKNLLQIDSKGYYYYNCKENYAEYDEDENSFILYDSPGANGSFFPFDPAEEVAGVTDTSGGSLDHFFGLTMTTRFIQRYGGYIDSNRSTPTTFEFSGDDDVWIFIDGVLAADLGGIHDEKSVSIDFVEGTVTIDNVTSSVVRNTVSAEKKTTKFSDIFKGTDVELNSDGTLTDNSSHTLKFFYLERGGNASNLKLRYNLTEIPSTSIYKVDQYGDNVSGAAFAFYPASVDGDAGDGGNWSYLASDGGTIPADTLDDGNFTYASDGTWDIVCEAGTIEAGYYGATDSLGSMTFVDSYGMPMSLADIQDSLGSCFIMREVSIPEGYRTVSDEAFLYIANGTTLMSADPYSTGVWTSPNAQITATNTLYAADADSVPDGVSGSGYYDKDKGTIDFYDLEGDAHGALFAVVLKRNGENADAAGLKDLTPDTWYPLYGNDEAGYEVSENSGMAAVIEAAKRQAEFSDNIFTAHASGMQLTYTDLPGDPTQYYSYVESLANNGAAVTVDASKPQYVVAYYWTAAKSLDGANETNTVRVASHATTTSSDADTGFDVLWGATIEVPNVINALYFQKADESVSTLIDGAVFALYGAKTDRDGKGYFVADGGSGNTVYIRLDEDKDGGREDGAATVYASLDSGSPGTEGTYSIETENITIPEEDTTGLVTDSGAGVITVTADGNTYAITPAVNAGNESLVGYTHDVCAHIREDGTGHFKYLRTGNYFLKEIAAPWGYVLNSENVMVMVNNGGVYACAGAADNGVRVGNDPGYLVKTLDVLASVGHVDETLSWIYGLLKVDADNTTAFQVHAEETVSYGVNDISYPLMETNVTGGGADSLTENGDPYGGTSAMTAYMQYDGSANAGGASGDSVFDYAAVSNGQRAADFEAAREDGSEAVSSADGTGTIRLWTEIGWSDMVICQDAVYGRTQTRSTTEYTDLSKYGDIANLFSSSTFVQVSDAVNIDLTVAKVTDDFYANPDAENTTTVYLDGAEFTLTRYVEENTGDIVTRETAADKNGAVKDGYTLQYYDPGAESWGTTEKKLTSVTTFTDGSNTEYSVTSQVYAYRDDNHHMIYTKVYTVNGQTYRLDGIEDGTATLKPVTVTITKDGAGQPVTVTDDTGRGDLTGTLARSCFKIRGLSQGTCYLTETKGPGYIAAGGTSGDFQNLSETVITISDGKYYYYEKDDNKIIVTNADEVKTDPATGKLYIELTEDEKTVRYSVFEGSNFSVSIDGGDASYLVELDNKGTTAAYYEDAADAVQIGFRVNNTSQSADTDIQLVKVDGERVSSVTATVPGFTDDNGYFAVGGDKDGDGVGDYDDVSAVYRILTGAEFKLYRLSDEEGDGNTETKLYYRLNADGMAEVTGSEADATVLKTDEKGYVKIPGLNCNYTYYLVETKAPDGYSPLTHEIKISWPDGYLKISDESAAVQETILPPLFDDEEYIVICNESGYELPYTGGTGTIMFTVGGIAILAMLALVYGCGRNKKQENVL